MRWKTLGGMLALLAFALAASAGLTLRAQAVREPRTPSDSTTNGTPASIQDALLKPYNFPFTKPTALDEVARHLSRTLHAPVVIDRAAIDRMSLKIDDEVQLELDGVRLKTGLKLLLDQLDLTYRVIPEDNLLIITDSAGSADPLEQVVSQLQAFHRDLHQAQDSIDEIRTALGLGGDSGARVRKPTIIEEMAPGGGKESEKPAPKETPSSSPPARSRSGA